MSYRVQSVLRAIDILVVLSNGPRTVTEIAKATELAKGTAFRILASLSHQGFTVRDPAGNRYMLGPGLLPLIDQIQANLGWIGSIAGPQLSQLWEHTSETVTMHVRIGIERVCIAELPSPHAIRYTASVGSMAPLSVGSAGKVLLAFMDQSEFEQMVDRLPLTAVTENSITERTELVKEVERTRKRGWATSRGERVLGSAAVSVPVSIAGIAGLETVALSVLGPAQRMPQARCQEYIPVMKKTAARVQKEMADREGATEVDDERRA